MLAGYTQLSATAAPSTSRINTPSAWSKPQHDAVHRKGRTPEGRTRSSFRLHPVQKRACSSGVGLDTGRQRTRRASPLLPEGVVASATSAGHGAELRCGGGFLPGSGGGGQLLGLLLQSPRGGFELRPPRPHSRFRI